jgi:hypothetical protein
MEFELREDTKIIACATVAEELRQLGVLEESLRVLEFGLHARPEKLKETLQLEIEAIDSANGSGDIILGYGLCSNAAVGLRSSSHRLIVPRVDDCIALFLGSREEHLRKLAEEPGTYFLTKGWIEAAEGPLYEYEQLKKKYGEERAMKVAKVILANYTRVALINTGNYRMEEYRAFARSMADLFDLRFEEIPGSNRLLIKMLKGDFNAEFVVVEPGESIKLDDFLSR